MYSPIKYVAALCLATATHLASAGIITLTPSATNLQINDFLSIDVGISGLSAGTAPSVASFDLSIEFDTTILSPAVVVFGNGLGPSSSTSVSGIGPVSVIETSLEADAYLNLNQPASFQLFEIGFNVVGNGTSTVDGTINALLGTGTPPVDLQPNWTVGSVATVTSGPATGIPEPHTTAMLWLGLLGVMAFRPRGRSKLSD